MWGQIMSNGHLPRSLPKPEPKTQVSKYPSSVDFEPLSMKRVDPVGDYWITANTCKMGTFSFQITASQLNDIQSKINGPSFESLSAIIWHSLAKIRPGSEPRVITVCRNGSNSRKNGYSVNHQIFGIVKAEFSIMDSNPSELAALIVDQTVNETGQIERMMEKDQGLSDFIVYGANLTFLDLEEAELYGLELKGKKPVFANYTADGIGDEGAVLVLPGPSTGRIVTVILPEDQVLQLRTELEKEWFVV
ncbi:hypothetical protein BVC80_693g19 [Macleaya cordata]|uniref:Transferase n=1 Tax=Macleaya cordata TaxID=56857 RepID=A0A200Q0N2_MACCD|nr:hypothetical protein BVC80_693g19 [Macleaya cordata]